MFGGKNYREKESRGENAPYTHLWSGFLMCRPAIEVGRLVWYVYNRCNQSPMCTGMHPSRGVIYTSRETVVPWGRASSVAATDTVVGMQNCMATSLNSYTIPSYTMSSHCRAWSCMWHEREAK